MARSSQKRLARVSLRAVLLLVVSASACAQIIGADEWTPKETDESASAASAASGAGGGGGDGGGGAGGGDGADGAVCSQCVTSSQCAVGCCSPKGVCLNIDGGCPDVDACANGCKDDTEGDVDCGSSCPNKCGKGLACMSDKDCIGILTCQNGTCQTALMP